ncbi:hypothetical protein HX109_07700 [Galbibacter sp. BG1]|uniref:hypothetical protein n=1 Tax=Galbibacter sp. BG1 TaxID=1170699 RepID=UPI0015C1AD64|nr:hypothetical protein [Galbibacter sp. BG1]QLE01454.1 hypothetical protein HX109_07700 [Galbibacter sp. BG1]
MLTKKKLQEQIANFPDQFTLDDLIDRLLLIEKIEEGDAQSKRGEIISNDAFIKETKEWFK